VAETDPHSSCTITSRAPHTWLAAIGWRRHGLIDLDEMPAGRRRGR
jgi:hypothetical protein